jgi:hypothetical protein
MFLVEVFLAYGSRVSRVVESKKAAMDYIAQLKADGLTVVGNNVVQL